MFMTLIEYRGAKYFMILEFYKLQFFLLYRFIQGEGKIRTKIIFSSNGKKIKTKENFNRVVPFKSPTSESRRGL